MLNFMALYRPQGWKNEYYKIWEANSPTLGVGQKAKKCLKLAPSFSALTPGVKWALFPQIMTKGSQMDVS
jgi:hypothetical protein